MIGKQFQLPSFDYNITAEQKLFLNKYGHVVSKLRRDPVLTARMYHGIVVPPHERQMWRGIWQEFKESHFVGGRATAKSAAVASMAMTLRAETRGRRKFLSLSASKFRGGKVIMEEAADFIYGRFKDQRQICPFPQEMLVHGSGLKREGDRWTIPFSTHSSLNTIPTGNVEAARGLRSNWLVLDEADNWLNEIIKKYFEPFISAGTSFDSTAEGLSENSIFYVGTVTYGHKDWAMTLEDREKMLSLRMRAQQALLRRDHDTYFSLMEQNEGRLWKFSACVQKWDYTDLIVPLVIRDPFTKEDLFEVFYPAINRDTQKIEINPKRMVEWDRREKRNYLYTYPIIKSQIEGQLEDGMTDFDLWAAENRCEVIKSSGSVYPAQLLDNAINTELLTEEELKKAGWDYEEMGMHYPPLLYECSDPCVLGVDPARTADFTAFVVIRLGELASGTSPYNPFSGTGNTTWNNVIWAEAHRKLTIKDTCKIIYDLKQRYNIIVSSPNPELAYGIGMDARGTAAGTTIQDELARPTPDVDDLGNPDPTWKQPQLIYDPVGEDYKHLAMAKNAWPGLRLLWASDELNTQWVSYSKGLMEQAKLYIAKQVKPKNDKMMPGYLGVASLYNQLIKVTAEPTKYHLKFVIPGDERRLENKDDLFKAFLYAVSAAKAHLAILTRKRNAAPVAHGIVVKPRMNRMW
jgi:hypothetical protein